MNVKRLWVFPAVAVAAAACLASHEPERRTAGGAVVPAAAAGMVVYIDPASGAFVEPHAGAVPVALDEDVVNALSTSAEGLVETPSPVPGGGVMVDLRGRFQSTHVAVVDAGGHLATSCRFGLPHAHGAGAACQAAPDSGAEAKP